MYIRCDLAYYGLMDRNCMLKETGMTTTQRIIIIQKLMAKATNAKVKQGLVREYFRLVELLQKETK